MYTWTFRPYPSILKLEITISLDESNFQPALFHQSILLQQDQFHTRQPPRVSLMSGITNEGSSYYWSDFGTTMRGVGHYNSSLSMIAVRSGIILER